MEAVEVTFQEKHAEQCPAISRIDVQEFCQESSHLIDIKKGLQIEVEHRPQHGELTPRQSWGGGGGGGCKSRVLMAFSSVQTAAADIIYSPQGCSAYR